MAGAVADTSRSAAMPSRSSVPLPSACNGPAVSASVVAAAERGPSSVALRVIGPNAGRDARCAISPPSGSARSNVTLMAAGSIRAVAA